MPAEGRTFNPTIFPQVVVFSEFLGVALRYREALMFSALTALLACVLIMPQAIRKLRGAKIVGIDRHKADRPKIPEMGGLGVFAAFNIGSFAILAMAPLDESSQILLLAGLVVIAGAAFTGALDDLIILRQKFKAAIPFAFAAPLSILMVDTGITFPMVGAVNFGLLYALVLVPAGIACASNGFNMLEGYNGLGTGLGIIGAIAMAVIVMISGDAVALAVLAPLVGALAGFWIFNAYPAKIFPGDTLLLMIGAALGVASIIGKVEFWGLLLLAPHIVEFFLKMKGKFAAPSFADHQENGMQIHKGPIRSIPHIPMKIFGPMREPTVVLVVHASYLVLAVLVVLGAALSAT